MRNAVGRSRIGWGTTRRYAGLALCAALGAAPVAAQGGPPYGVTCPVPPHTTPDPGTMSHVWAGRLFTPFSLDGEELWVGEDGGRIRHRDPVTGLWSFQPTPKEVRGAIHRIHFLLNGLTGWAVSADAYVLHTTDGGNSWNAIARIPALPGTLHVETLAEWEQLYNVWFDENGDDGLLVAERGILYSADGGVCWTPAERRKDGVALTRTEIAHFWIALYGLAVRNEPGSSFLGLAVGRPGVVFRSTDLGRVWDLVLDWEDLCAMVPSTCLAAPCPGPATEPWFEPWDVEIGSHPTEPLALAAVSVGANCGMMLASADEGQSWVRELHECEHPASGVSCDCTTGCDDEYDPSDPPYRWSVFRGLFGVGIFPDNSAVAAGYNGQHLLREVLTDGTGVTTGGLWRDRSTFGPWTMAPRR